MCMEQSGLNISHGKIVFDFGQILGIGLGRTYLECERAGYGVILIRPCLQGQDLPLVRVDEQLLDANNGQAHKLVSAIRAAVVHLEQYLLGSPVQRACKQTDAIKTFKIV